MMNGRNAVELQLNRSCKHHFTAIRYLFTSGAVSPYRVLQFVTRHGYKINYDPVRYMSASKRRKSLRGPRLISLYSCADRRRVIIQSYRLRVIAEVELN